MLFKVIIFIFLLFETLITYVRAEEVPTIVEAEAATATGGRNISIVEQPAGAPNPLGNPIVGPYVAPRAYNAADASGQINNNQQATTQMQSTQTMGAWQEAKKMGKEFSNTLSEEGGQIYDLQTFPVQDVKLIDNSANPQIIYSPDAD